MCVVPDNDLFNAISSGAASVVTDRIVRFTENGILLESGTELEADIIVTATGLNMVPFGQIDLHVDGEKVDLHDRLLYKTADGQRTCPTSRSSSATPTRRGRSRSDLVSDYVCRLLAHMDRHGYTTVTPVADDPALIRRPFIELQTGYVSRAMHLFPQQGSHGPWTAEQSYAKDKVRLRTVEDPALRFTDTVSGRRWSPRERPHERACERIMDTARWANARDEPAMSYAPTIISVEGRRTRVRIEGDPAHRPVVLLHGIGRSLEDWGPQYTRLARTHRVIALDLPGSGFSARSPERTTLTVLARCVLETLDAIGERRPLHVVGNSLGGAVAQQMLALEPDRVAGLVLVNSAGFGSEVALPLRLIAIPVIGELLTATHHPRRRPDVRTAALRRPAAGQLGADRPRTGHRRPARPERRDARDHPGTRHVARHQGRLAEELAGAVAQHPRPTLIVWGDRDRVLPARHLEAARRLLPHADTHLFTGIGHMPQIECPDEFGALVLAFLGDIDRAEQPDPASAPVGLDASTQFLASPNSRSAQAEPGVVDATVEVSSGRAVGGSATSEHGTQLIVGGWAREERGVLLVEGKPGLPVDEHRVGVLARLVHDHSNVGLFGRTVDGSPLVQRDQHRQEGVSGCGEHVLVPRRTLAVAATLQQSGMHESPEPARQGVGGDPQTPLELVEPRHAMGRITQDEDAPPFADAFERQRDGAVHVLEALAFHESRVRRRASAPGRRAGRSGSVPAIRR